MAVSTPFTYLVKFSHPHTGRTSFYYGVRYAKNCHPKDLFATYFTSSSCVQKLLKQFGSGCFSWEIRQEFPDDPMRAYLWEQKVLRRFGVLARRDFLNLAINGANGKIVTACHKNRLPISEETREKIRQKKLGVPRPAWIIEKMAATHRGVSLTKEQREKMSASLSGDKHKNFGKPLSEATRSKISETLKTFDQTEFCRQLAREREPLRLFGAANPMFGKPSPRKGKKMSPESIERMREAQRNRWTARKSL